MAGIVGVLLGCALALLPATRAAAAPRGAAVEALREWHKRWLAGVFDLTPGDPGTGGRHSSVSDLLQLVSAAVAEDPAAAARTLLDVATRDFGPRREYAIGKDAERLKRYQPLRVRDAARAALLELPFSPDVVAAMADAFSVARAKRTAPASADARELAAEWLGRKSLAARADPTAPLRAYALVRALREDPDEWVRAGAARGLRTLGAIEAAPHLASALASADRTDASARVRREAAIALGAVVSASLPPRGECEPDDSRVAVLCDAVERDGDELVRRAAVKSLGKLPSLGTVDRLARHLASRPAGRSAAEITEIRDLLARLTGAFASDDDPGAWLAWWERERGVARLSPRAGVEPTEEERRYSSRFYGIPIVGERVVFVLDVSGSMAQPGTNPPATKIEEARAELESALKTLPESSRFNVILFSSDVDVWRTALRRAAPFAKAEARDFFDSRKANGSTDLCGGLLEAFGAARVGGARRAEPDELPDQIVILSDGEPTAGLLVDPTDIRLEVRRLNRDDAVRVDAVAIGAGAALLLQRLAAENGGVCERIDPREGRAARAAAKPKPGR